MKRMFILRWHVFRIHTQQKVQFPDQKMKSVPWWKESWTSRACTHCAKRRDDFPLHHTACQGHSKRRFCFSSPFGGRLCVFAENFGVSCFDWSNNHNSGESWNSTKRDEACKVHLLSITIYSTLYSLMIRTTDLVKWFDVNLKNDRTLAGLGVVP